MLWQSVESSCRSGCAESWGVAGTPARPVSQLTGLLLTGPLCCSGGGSGLLLRAGWNCSIGARPPD